MCVLTGGPRRATKATRPAGRPAGLLPHHEGTITMACRVGMSTVPYDRIIHWIEKEQHTHYEILDENLTYEEALELEKIEAMKRNCRYASGGQYVPGPVWSIYHLWGGR